MFNLLDRFFELIPLHHKFILYHLLKEASNLNSDGWEQIDIGELALIKEDVLLIEKENILYGKFSGLIFYKSFLDEDRITFIHDKMAWSMKLVDIVLFKKKRHKHYIKTATNITGD